MNCSHQVLSIAGDLIMPSHAHTRHSVQAYGVSGNLETYGVEVAQVVDGGARIRCQQACYCMKRRQGAVQEFVGARDALPAGRS